jgi:hypothetical protein
MFSSSMDTVDELMSGVKYGCKGFEWDDELFSKFSGYIHDEEERLKTGLVLAQYRIDAQDMLALITGPGRLEKVSALVSYNISSY